MILKGKRFAVGPVFFTIAMVVVCLLCLQCFMLPAVPPPAARRSACSWQLALGRARPECPRRLVLTLPKAAALRMPPTAGSGPGTLVRVAIPCVPESADTPRRFLELADGKTLASWLRCVFLQLLSHSNA